jgi:glycosyltransferase involved in cell wall biosynthesis
VPEARLVLAGDGPEREPLRRLAQRLGVADRVTFLGFVPRAAVPGLLASADVQVLPSIYEELGTAVLEGMRIGVPLVASETGGLPSLVTHGVTGLLVPPGDAAALAGALRRLLADRELAARLADQARRESRDYSWTALAERVLAVYRRVLPAPAARR